MGGFRLSQQAPNSLTRPKEGSGTAQLNVSTDQDSADPTQLQLRQSERALKRTRHHLQLQETRSRQLVTACAAKLREKQAEAERQLTLKDRQFQRILQQLAVLQSRLKREQKLIAARQSEQEQVSEQQARELDRLRRTNRRLLGKVSRLSAPCARCGTKPDSGISDCEQADQTCAKVAKVAAGVTAGSPDSALASSETSSDAASPPTAERGIMKTSRGKAPQKTVTFSLQDKENTQPDQCQPRKPRPRPPLPFKPRLILPPGAHVSETTAPQPSIVDTISQLLGVELEETRRGTNHTLSVIPEDLETSRDSSHKTAEPAEQQPPTDHVMVTMVTTTESTDDSCEEQRCEKQRNAPRSRSNINLIMSEREGVRIKDNFEEFKLEDDIANSVCSDTASERSTENGADPKTSLDRRAGDGAESEPAHRQALQANYDKFLERSGLSQKAIRIPKRLLTNHRSMLKPSDVKYRHRSKMFEGITIEDISPTSVRYYSEEL